MTVAEFQKWLDVGIVNGWVSNIYCETHDGTELTDEEMREFDEGWDPCLFAVRVWTERIET